MSKTWVDVTTTLKWTRPAVGVVRVEHELIKALLKDKHDQLRFFKYEYGQFIPIESKIVTSKINGEKLNENDDSGTIIQSSNATKLNNPFRFNKSKLKAGVKLIMHGLYEISMSLFKDAYYLRINHRIRQNINLLKMKLKISAKRLLGLKNKSFESGNKLSIFRSCNFVPHLFAENDTVIIFGLAWDYLDIYRHLYKVKKSTNLNVISMCYDLIPYKYPNLVLGNVASYFANYYCEMSWASDHVACISKSSQADFLEFLNKFKIREPKTSVVHLGSEVSKNIICDTSESVQNVLQEKFILFVSTIERRKNHETLIKAIHFLMSSGVKSIPKLVFVGMRGWGIDDMLKDLELNNVLKDNIVLLNHVTDAELSVLYKNCSFFVYPSFYEGWGLPIAEALAYGKFGICSSTSSMPEVGGNFVDYCNPFDVVGWANAINKYSNNDELLREKEQIINDDFIPFTWEKFGNQILSIMSDELYDR